MILIRGFAYRFIIHLGQNWNATWRNARSRHLEPRGTRPDDKSNTLLPMARFFPIFFSFFPPLSLIPFRPTNSSSSFSFARRPNRAIETRKEERNIFSRERSVFENVLRGSRAYYHECAYEARHVKDVRADVLNYAQTNHFGTIEARKYSCAMTRPVLGNSIYVTVPQLLFTRVAIPPRTRISRFDSRQRRGEVDALLVLRTPIHIYIYLFIYLSRAGCIDPINFHDYIPWMGTG